MTHISDQLHFGCAKLEMVALTVPKRPIPCKICML
ncbi:MAG: hypothetical protein ACD_10C00438G0002 [uncultured bacterium]|nr:MAG: hypothetical protein ACD_10C00438G0002 [uncultured bacterium]